MGTLTTVGVKALRDPGRYSDGANLYLQITKTGSRSWLFIYRWNGKQREMGLGPFPDVGLADAREAAEAARKLLKNKSNPQDPLQVRRSNQAQEAATPNFGEFAESVIDNLEIQWRNSKHRAQWRSSLRIHASALFSLPVNEIDTESVLACLKPIWRKIPETAGRVRGRIEKILDAAKARRLRDGENPARWRGHLDHLLPRRDKLARGHHSAMAYNQVSAFVSELRNRSSMSANVLEFLILCASRSGEVLGATWDEFDMDTRVWSIPASRMKGRRLHRVPLCDRAVLLLEGVAPLATVDSSGRRIGSVFKGARGGELSAMALAMQMRRMGQGHYTVHGFRSAFRDWAGEVSVFPREIAEAALAHTVGDATERAYRRGDALEKRRLMMEAWAAYIEPKSTGNVVEFCKPTA